MRYLLAVSFLFAITSCQGIIKSSIKRDASIVTRCDESRIRVIQTNGHVASVDACGRPYTCESVSTTEDQLMGIGHWRCHEVRR